MILKERLEKLRSTLSKKNVTLLCRNTESIIVKAIAKSINPQVKDLLRKRSMNKIIFMGLEDSRDYMIWYNQNIEISLCFENDYTQHYIAIESLFFKPTKWIMYSELPSTVIK
jgi:hypothetical protein